LSYDAGIIYRIVPSSLLPAGAAETDTNMSPTNEQDEDSANDGDEDN
jgi:hypothetical protein